MTGQVRTLVQYLDERLGPHRGSGPEYVWPCPACIDKVGSESSKPKLHINLAKSIGHCYRCDYSFGRFETLFRFLNNGQLRIEEARIIRREVRPSSEIAVRAVRDALREHETIDSDDLRRVRLPDEVIDLSGEIPSMAKAAMRYLRGRGIEPELIERHQIGFCATGRYGGYLTFPVMQDGEQIYFTTRYAGKVLDGRKSNNPPKADGFHAKSTCLLNFDGASGRKIVAIVEGPFDMMAFDSTSDVRAVALMGKVISDRQVALIDQLVKRGTREIVVSLDSDAGKFGHDIYRRLLGRVPKVTMLPLREGDPFDNRRRLPQLLAVRGAPSTTSIVRARYRSGPLVRRGALRTRAAALA